MTDWSALNPDGSTRDPVPGNPDEVSSLARWFRQMSNDVSDSVAAIQRFDVSAGWRDQAAKRFDEHMGTLKDDLPKLRDSYGRAAWALTTYASQLRTSRQQAQQALSIALEARANVDSAQKAKAAVTAAPVSGGPPPDTSSYDRQEQDGHDRLSQARSLLRQACDDRDHAAATCRRQIQDAHNLGMQNRSWWDHVTEAVGEAWHAVDAHLEDISKWCSRISMVLAVAGMFFPVLEPIAIGIAVIGLAADAGLAAEGKKGWGEVILTGGLMVATFGMGALAKGLAGKVVERIGGEMVPAGERVVAAEAKLASQQAKLADAASRGEANAALKGWVTRRAGEVEDAKAEVSRLGKARQLFEEKPVDPWKDRLTHISKWTQRENMPTWNVVKSPGVLAAAMAEGGSASVRLARAALPIDVVAQGVDKLNRLHDNQSGVSSYQRPAEGAP